MSINDVTAGKRLPHEFNMIIEIPMNADPIKFEMDKNSCKNSGALAVLTDKSCPLFTHWRTIEDVPEIRLKQIQHFFEHYKDLEANEWVKVIGWPGLSEAHSELKSGIKRYEDNA